MKYMKLYNIWAKNGTISQHILCKYIGIKKRFFPPNAIVEFTQYNQNLVLLMAAMNNEL